MYLLSLDHSLKEVMIIARILPPSGQHCSYDAGESAPSSAADGSRSGRGGGSGLLPWLPPWVCSAVTGPLRAVGTGRHRFPGCVTVTPGPPPALWHVRSPAGTCQLRQTREVIDGGREELTSSCGDRNDREYGRNLCYGDTKSMEAALCLSQSMNISSLQAELR